MKLTVLALYLVMGAVSASSEKAKTEPKQYDKRGLSDEGYRGYDEHDAGFGAVGNIESFGLGHEGSLSGDFNAQHILRAYGNGHGSSFAVYEGDHGEEIGGIASIQGQLEDHGETSEESLGSKQDHEVVTVTKQIPFPVPHPYPVEVIKHIPVPVSHPFPYLVDKPYPVHVDKPYPVTVEKPVPFTVEKKVLFPVYVPQKVQVPHPFEVYVPRPIPFVFHVPVRVPVPHPVTIFEKVPVFVHFSGQGDEGRGGKGGDGGGKSEGREGGGEGGKEAEKGGGTGGRHD